MLDGLAMPGASDSRAWQSEAVFACITKCLTADGLAYKVRRIAMG